MYIYIYLYCIILIIKIEWCSGELILTWCLSGIPIVSEWLAYSCKPLVALTFETPTSGLDVRGDSSNTIQLPDCVQNPTNDRFVPCFIAWVRALRMS